MLSDGEKSHYTLIKDFKDIHKQQQLPFCIYSDFESLLPKVTDEKDRNTEKISWHDISGYSYAITSPYFPTEFRSYRGQNRGID